LAREVEERWLPNTGCGLNFTGKGHFRSATENQTNTLRTSLDFARNSSEAFRGPTFRRAVCCAGVQPKERATVRYFGCQIEFGGNSLYFLGFDNQSAGYGFGVCPKNRRQVKVLVGLMRGGGKESAALVMYAIGRSVNPPVYFAD
jgi:hypothetical protein